MKNPCTKTVKLEQAYEVWGNSPVLPGWTWYILKKWQIDDNKPNARWFCCVKTPIVPEGEYGDVYVKDIKDEAMAVLLCKGCKNPLDPAYPNMVRNALSRYGHGFICSPCGTKEALEGDFITKQNHGT